MKKYLIALLALLSLSIYAQEETGGKTYVQFDVASAITPPHRISIGISHQLNERFFIGIEGGKSFSGTWGRLNDKAENYKLHQYRMEVGYILNTKKKYVSPYLSVDFMGLNHKETLFDGYYYVNKNDINEQRFSYDKIDYHRKKHTFNFNYGMKIFFSKSKKVGIDPKIGLGIKNVDVAFSKAKNLQEVEKKRDPFGFTDRYTRFGKETSLNVNIQLRFFYVF
ncbi:MAG TPA: hypothetical protein VKY82_06195 [Flavobacterium sp.]|nr:hypothetical protein [Flavobacterium sp.]